MSEFLKANGGLRLGIPGFEWSDLHDPEGLRRLHDAFVAELRESDPDAHAQLLELAAGGIPAKRASAIVVRVGPRVGAFVAKLFGIEREVEALSRSIVEEEPVFLFKKVVAKKRVPEPGAVSAWTGSIEDAHAVTSGVVEAFAPVGDDAERRTAIAALRVHAIDEIARKAARAGGASWTDALRADAVTLRGAIRWTSLGGEASDALDDGALASRVLDAIGASLAARRADEDDPVSRWPSLEKRHDLHFDRLVELRVARGASAPGEVEGPLERRRERVEPFALTDHRMAARRVAAEVDLCLDCHQRDKDSCSAGLRDNKTQAIKKNPLGIGLEGCPLEQPIGEMNELRRAGEAIASLAAVTIANAMCAGTGHRICNDCMKACVFQTQEPVNIPEIETRVLDDVLRLPWGFEIWSLLGRWNPLRVSRPYPRPYIGKNVLVVGLGPAGYTLSHHLANEGFGVVAIDGLKIEPLPEAWLAGPIRDVGTLRAPLEERIIGGFGGVSEYGITVRWDKSFLSLIHLSLARRPTFRAHGGVRFGGTITIEDAWELGFDHVAIAAGAGKPTLIPVPNGLARGVRQASDFLMALQLSGAMQRASLAQLQVRLPAVVIGGGLTAIDAATELLAYYVVQVERTLARVEEMAREQGGEDAVLGTLDAEERGVVREHLAHARAIRDERARAALEHREPRISELLDGWGGVRIAYRRRLVDSPAYRLNHEEVAKSLEEGVRYLELVSPAEVIVDAHGAAEAIRLDVQAIREDGSIGASGESVTLPARTILVAAGTRPNVTYEREHAGSMALDRTGYFANHVADVAADGAISLRPSERNEGFFTSYLREGRTVSYYGDNHPKYAGSVVKAMASAKDGHPYVTALFAREIAALDPAEQPARDAAWRALAARLGDSLTATVHDVRPLAPGIVEVVVRAPLAARRFRPGQFYRLQNLESSAARVDLGDGRRQPLVTEGMALTGAWTDPERGLVSVIVLELGASTKLCERLRPGERVMLMGPTGAPTEIPSGESVLLIGGGLGNAVLFSIARALREAGSRVLYVAGYRRGELAFKQSEIEASADQIVWATDAGEPITPRRPQDRHVRANVVDALLAFERGELGEKAFSLREVDRILAIGSDGMMKAVRNARHGVLAPYLDRAKVALGSINSPMQCMMKEICGQCLQRHCDPVTGKERFVYTCCEQDQPLDHVDFDFLRQRLRQSSAHEKLADAWLAHVLARAERHDRTRTEAAE